MLQSRSVRCDLYNVLRHTLAKSPLARSLTNDVCSSDVEGEVWWMTFLPSAERIWLVESKVNYSCWLHTLRKTNIPLARHICACLTGVAESNRCLYLEEDRSDV